MNKTDSLRELTAAAERFVNKAPRQSRLELERTALLDAITRAQLVLSISGSQKESESNRSDDSSPPSLLDSPTPVNKKQGRKQRGKPKLRLA